MSEDIPVSIAAYEQRLQVLEAAVADLRSQQSAREAGRTGGPTDDLTSDVDQPLIPAVPPKQLSRLRAKLCCVQPGPRNLGLSQAEWTALNLGEADE
jgi:hypothetical protein